MLVGQRGARGTPRMQHLLAGAEDSEVRDTRSGAGKSQRLVREAEIHKKTARHPVSNSQEPKPASAG